MKLQDLNAMISVRDFTFRSIDNILIKINKEDVKALQNKLAALDKAIINGILKLDLSNETAK